MKKTQEIFDRAIELVGQEVKKGDLKTAKVLLDFAKEILIIKDK
jgi:hypothetical protein